MADNPHTVKRGELDVIQIDNAACSAEISLFGGHILQWQPSGQKPVLWMSDDAIYDGKTALRGGIPVCWPWFGPVDGKGRHGLVRNLSWQLSDFQETGNATYVELSLQLTEQQNPWPHPNNITMKITFGETLLQSLIISNASDKPQCFAFALHNYLQVSNPATVKIPLLANCFFEDKVTGQQQQLEDRDTLPTGYAGPLDRIYHSDDSVEVIDTEWQRIIRIDKQNSQQWVVWNPGNEDAKSMIDLHDNGETQFLCVETANTTDLVLEPEESRVISQTISIRTPY